MTDWTPEELQEATELALRDFETIEGILDAKPYPEPDRAKMKCRVPKWRPPRKCRAHYSSKHIQVVVEAAWDRQECMECGVRSEGYNFHIHHINRKHDDNRLENLEILCPNCHWARHHNGEPLPEFHDPDEGYLPARL